MRKAATLFSALALILAVAAPALADELITVHCTLCGLCPAPLGLCVFVWPLVILIPLLLLVCLVGRGRGKDCPVCGTRCRRKAKTCKGCGYEFNDQLPLMPPPTHLGLEADPFRKETVTRTIPDGPTVGSDTGVVVLGSAKPAAVPLVATSQQQEFDPFRKAAPTKPVVAGPVVGSDTIASQQASPELDGEQASPVLDGATASLDADAEKEQLASAERRVEDAAPYDAEQASPVFGGAEAPAEPEIVEQAVEQTSPPVEADTKPCPHCGAELPQRAMFCGHCGQRL